MRNAVPKLNPKKNPDAVATFAHLASGILSAVQINEMMKRKPVKKRRRNPETQAQINARMAKVRAARNPVGGKRKAVGSKRKNPAAAVSKLRNPATPKLSRNPRIKVAVPAKGRFYLQTIARGDDVLGVFINDRDGDGVAKKFKTVAAAKAYATKQRLRLENPSATPRKINPQFAPAWIKALLKPATKRKANPKPKASATRTSVRAMPTAAKRNAAKKVAVKRKANPTPKPKAPARKRNAAKVPHRRTFTMFNGRPATKAKTVAISPLIGRNARVDQLGQLVEIHLEDGTKIKTNPAKFSLVAKGGRLWIAGGKFHNGTPPTRKINPWGKIKNIVYSTHKPHHGDRPGQHYIHEMGEWSGNRPTLAIDNQGFPVIQGGSYKIEARGIVD